MALPNAILMSGVRADQPAAAAANNGCYYRVTDEGNAVEQSTGSAWVPIAAAGTSVGKLLTADPASPANDDWWMVRTGASPTMTAAVKVRIAGVTYTVAAITL